MRFETEKVFPALQVGTAACCLPLDPHIPLGKEVRN
jgi:hypothetical protein